MERKAKFIDIVHTLALAYYIQGEFNIGTMSDILGKAYKVSETDLHHQNGFISDKATDFVRYQGYITKTRPVWYTGPEN